jgi:hypothetical protein
MRFAAQLVTHVGGEPPENCTDAIPTASELYRCNSDRNYFGKLQDCCVRHEQLVPIRCSPDNKVFTCLYYYNGKIV